MEVEMMEEASQQEPLAEDRRQQRPRWRREEAKRDRRDRLLLGLSVLSMVSLVLAVAALANARPRAGGGAAAVPPPAAAVAGGARPMPQIRRLAFGSCTSYDLRPQPIWTQGVIPSLPDAFVWLGDFTYMDDPLLDCSQVPSFPECNCSADFLRRPPFQCFAGDPQHARTRVQHQLSIPEYQQFLSFMCPDSWASSSSSSSSSTEGAGAGGTLPPPAASCARPVFGTWDDHDFGWNNGNRRNPAKAAIKQVYLDGIGEAQDSPRRSSVAGLQASYVLPGPGGSGGGGRLRDEIQLILLDERWERDTLPCSAREDWCAAVLRNASAQGGNASRPPSAGDVVWCEDFLLDGGMGQGGSCCRKDDEWGAWCRQPAHNSHPSWQEVCDPTSEVFARRLVLLDTDNATVLPLSDVLWSGRQSELSARLLEATSSPVCEFLGLQQRLWLQQLLSSSRAALTVVASGSVLAGSLGFHEEGGSCSGDDLACWPRAQVNLLHTLANASGCVVVLVGDFHYSDLKVIQPGAGRGYAELLRSQQLRQPVYQAMSSGMTHSTAEHLGAASQPCRGSYREDLTGLRPLGRCSYVPDPAFGMLEVDWESRVVSLSVRNASTGAVAHAQDGTRQLLRFSLDGCRMLAG